MLRHSLPDRNSCILGQLLLHLRTWPTISTHDLMRHALRGQPGFLHLDVLLYRSPAMPSNERDTADSAWRAHYDWRLQPAHRLQATDVVPAKQTAEIRFSHLYILLHADTTSVTKDAHKQHVKVMTVYTG